MALARPMWWARNSRLISAKQRSSEAASSDPAFGAEIAQIVVGHKAQLFDIRLRIGQHQYRPGEFLFVAHEGIHKILDRRIDVADKGHMLHLVLEVGEYVAEHEGGGQQSHQRDDDDEHHEHDEGIEHRVAGEAHEREQAFEKLEELEQHDQCDPRGDQQDKALKEIFQ